jgi:hypothetical protein
MALPTSHTLCSASAVANPVAAVAAPPSHMLRLLSSDSGSRLALSHLLTLKDLAAVYACCHWWYNILRTTSLSCDHHVQSDERWESRPSLSSMRDFLSSWARQHVTSLALGFGEHSRGDDSPRRGPSWQEREVLRILPSLGSQVPNLKKLSIFLRVDALKEDVIRECFLSLDPGRLRSLAFRSEFSCYVGSATQMALRHVAVLQGLQHLEMEDNQVQYAHRLGFSGLASLPRLHTFIFRMQREEFHCTAQQVAALAACRSLTAISAGCWSPEQGRAWKRVPSAELQIEEGIATLVRGFASTASSASMIASSSSACASATRLPRALLRHLDLSAHTRMTPAVFDEVSQLPSLTDLSPKRWSAEMNEAQWAKLASFSELQSLKIYPMDANRDTQGRLCSQMRSEHFWNAMLHCHQLCAVKLGAGLHVSTDQLRVLVAQCPLLATLRFRRVTVGEVLVLAAAPSLTSLTLYRCRDFGTGLPLLKSTLPLLPSLRRLRLVEVGHLFISDILDGLMSSGTDALRSSHSARARTLKLSDRFASDATLESGEESTGEEYQVREVNENGFEDM